MADRDNPDGPPAAFIDYRRERMSQNERDAEDAESARARKAYARQTERFAGRSNVGTLLEGILGSQTRQGGPKRMAKGGAVKSSASSRADGCAARGKTKGRFV